jgi:RNA recognition motif-containing protein
VVEIIYCLAQKEYEMGTKLYVGNLSFQTQEYDLRDHFAPHGEVVSADIVTDRDTGRSRGFGFVEMSSEEEAQAAQSALDGQELDGRQLKINEAKPRNNDRRGGGGGGGRW